jgi:1-deoxy-D-xylulose-5-phosphate synthase
MAIIELLKTPADLKKLTIAELEVLSEEIRKIIIDTVQKNGGHLSSNLGVVETTLALHYVFDLPTDKIIFDVGHQCYAHKIITGRCDNFSSLRQEDGVSGFPDEDESVYDTFTSGHAGNAIAGGLGMCYSRDLKGEDYKVISLVGDASLMNGLSLEAMNVSSEKPKNFIVVLNDNGMSITKNENGLYKSIINSTTKRPYLAIKGGAKKLLGKTAFGRFLSRLKDKLKSIFNPHIYIDEMGFKYVGTIDGHNLKELVKTFKRVKEYGLPTFVHISTLKGKGHGDAEKRSDIYHGIGANLQVSENSFAESLGKKLCSLAGEIDNLVAITAGMTYGTGLEDFAKTYPNRFVDVGIAEEYAVTLSAGMATAGVKPFVCIYSTFLQRAYDQIVHDVCIKNLPVVFCIDRAGVVGSDGKTHQGVFDLSYLRHIPNLTLLCPKDTAELSSMIDYAVKLNSPVAIRYPNGVAPVGEEKSFDGKWEVLSNGTDNVTVLAVGHRAISVANDLKNYGVNATVINARSVKPLDEDMLLSIKNSLIVTIEDNVLAGGFGSAVMEYYSQKMQTVKVLPFGMADKFIAHATVSRQFEENGLTAKNIADKIKGLTD